MSEPQLKQIAKQLRIDILTMLYHAGSGHPGGALSSVEILTALYFKELSVRPQEPNWEDRDYFVLSKGHSCPVLYAALANRGFFDKSWYKTLRHINAPLQGHPDRAKTPGVEFNSGSLSQGFSFAAGIALGAKYHHRTNRICVLMGCGEMNEGQVWEAAMFSSHHQLNNLTAIVDYNGLQSDASNDEIMKLEPLKDKWIAFGWNAIEIDGHDITEIIDAFNTAKTNTAGPTVIIARTVKGKGVSFMEHVPKWHGSLAPSSDELAAAIKEIEAEQ